MRTMTPLWRTVRRTAPATVLVVAGILVLVASYRRFHWDLSRPGAGWVSLHLKNGRISAFISTQETSFLRSVAGARPPFYRHVITDYLGRMAFLDGFEQSYPALPVQGFFSHSVEFPPDTRPVDQRFADTRRSFREEFVRHLPQVLGDRSYYCRFTSSPRYGLVIRFPGYLLVLTGLAYLAFELIRDSTRRWWRQKHGLCVHCAYNLAGNTSGACPECGKRFELSEKLARALAPASERTETP